MLIEYEGQAYDFEMADITVKQAIKIEKYLGRPISEFGAGLDTAGGKSADLATLQCLGWLILHDGRGVPIEDTDFNLHKLVAALSDAFAKADAGAAAAPEAAAVPTGGAGMSMNGAGTLEGQLTAP